VRGDPAVAIRFVTISAVRLQNILAYDRFGVLRSSNPNGLSATLRPVKTMHARIDP
jgi:hypothetical protein